MEPRSGLAGLFAAALVLLAPSSAASDCGAFEDVERASHRALVWADFQGAHPRPGTRGGDRDIVVAQIHTSLRIDALSVASAQLEDGRWLARAERPCVRGYVLKQRSGRVASAVFVWQLAHEQGHFDLTQVYAQRLRGRLASLTVEAASAAEAERALRTEVEHAYRELSAEHAQAQRRYDRETNHGHRAGAQSNWVARVKAELVSREGR
jgi:hypothetical protein